MNHKSSLIPYHLWLSEDGTIHTATETPNSKHQTPNLSELHGRRPRQLVMSLARRKLLLSLVPSSSSSSSIRVDPALINAVNQAVAEYEAGRAPLVALNPIQRLGYLDEVDTIHCTANLGEANPLVPSARYQDLTPDPSHLTPSLTPFPLFAAGVRYPIRVCSVMVKRKGRKMNVQGEQDDVQWDGQELAIFIKDDLGQERLFMEERLRQDGVKVSVIAPGQMAAFKRLGVADVATPCAIDFSLQELVSNFNIPDVPDVAARNPERHQRNLDLLKQMEQLVNSP